MVGGETTKGTAEGLKGLPTEMYTIYTMVNTKTTKRMA